MSNREIGQPLTYDAIISVAENKALELYPSLPSLPSPEDLEPIIGKMWTLDRPLIDAVRRHLDSWGVAHRHSFEEHPEHVAAHAAYVASLECDERGIANSDRDQILRRTWRLGLLHDVQRWRGFCPQHQIEGMKAAEQLLDELLINDPLLLDMVLLHDKLSVDPRDDVNFDVPFYSVFAVDHLAWGTEWRFTKWDEKAKQGIDPEKAIHDYSFLYTLRDSQNLHQTKWGREVALPYINAGIVIAETVEDQFSKKVK